MTKYLPFLLYLSAGLVMAQPVKPSIPKPLYPLTLAIDAGKTTKVTVRGQRLDDVTEVRLQEPKSSGKVLGKARTVAVPNQMNAEAIGDRELDLEITLPKEVAGGLIALTLVGPGGESPPLSILVNDDTPRVAEQEPNDGFKQAQAVRFPQIVEATIKQNQDVDVYKLDVPANTTLRIDVQARRVGAPVEALLTLYDGVGRTIATGEKDSTRDPVLTVTVAKAGQYLLVVQDANDQGGPMFHYRLAVRVK